MARQGEEPPKRRGHMFETKGDLPEWRLVYDHAATLEVGDTITYDDLDAILGRDFKASRTPIYDAIRHLEQDSSRTLRNVQNVGYRVAQAIEHEELARHHHRKSGRSIRRAASKIASADRTQLTAEERRRFDDMQAQLDQQATMLRRLDTKVTGVVLNNKRTERAVGDVAARVERLAEALARHGITTEDQPQKTA